MCSCVTPRAPPPPLPQEAARVAAGGSVVNVLSGRLSRRNELIACTRAKTWHVWFVALARRGVSIDSPPTSNLKRRLIASSLLYVRTIPTRSFSCSSLGGISFASRLTGDRPVMGRRAEESDRTVHRSEAREEMSPRKPPLAAALRTSMGREGRWSRISAGISRASSSPFLSPPLTPPRRRPRPWASTNGCDSGQRSTLLYPFRWGGGKSSIRKYRRGGGCLHTLQLGPTQCLAYAVAYFQYSVNYNGIGVDT